MQSMSDLYSTRNILFLLAVGMLALLPVLLRRLRRSDRQARHRHVVSLLPIVAAPVGGTVPVAIAGRKASAVPTLSLPTPQKQLGAQHLQ
jgi:hypothetical protein